MSRSLEGRTALITGAGQGVGEGIARALAASGANVVIASRRAETGEVVAASIREDGGSAIFISTDVTVRADVEQCVERTVNRFGGLEIMVQNAFAGVQPHRIEDADRGEHWRQQAGTGVWSVLYCGQAAWPYLEAAGQRGRFIVITSPSGIEGSRAMPLYSAVKAAERAMVKSLAREWGSDGVTVNAIAPTAVTPALAIAFDRDPALRTAAAARTALRRLGDPTKDIGGVAAFLAGDAARYVTGQTIVADGGSCLSL